MPGGRPTKFTEEIADEIFAQMAVGKSVVRILNSDDKLPATTTFFRWLVEKTEFRDKYERALEARAAFFAEELVEISDDTGSDVQFSEDKDDNGLGAKPFICKENTAQRRLRIDTRKWVTSKLLPKKYGDKQEIELKTDIEELTEEQIDNKINDILREKGINKAPRRKTKKKGKE